jgi:hypothetical protein
MRRRRHNLAERLCILQTAHSSGRSGRNSLPPTTCHTAAEAAGRLFASRASSGRAQALPEPLLEPRLKRFSSNAAHPTAPDARRRLRGRHALSPPCSPHGWPNYRKQFVKMSPHTCNQWQIACELTKVSTIAASSAASTALQTQAICQGKRHSVRGLCTAHTQ